MLATSPSTLPAGIELGRQLDLKATSDTAQQATDLAVLCLGQRGRAAPADVRVGGSVGVV
jgi:hypothetical protein